MNEVNLDDYCSVESWNELAEEEWDIKELAKNRIGLNKVLIDKPDLMEVREQKKESRELDSLQFVGGKDVEFKVLVVGGRGVGIMRVADDESRKLCEKEVREKGTILVKIAAKVIALFGLQWGVVNMLEEEEEIKVVRVDGVESVEAWKKHAGVDVKKELVDLAKNLSRRGKSSVVDLVEDYFENSFDLLWGKRRHYASRMFLWRGRQVDKERLEVLEEGYIGSDDDQAKMKMEEILNKPRKESQSKKGVKKLRQEYVLKYSNLKKYNRLLFRVLFGWSLYGRDLRRVMCELTDEGELQRLRRRLLRDREGVMVLSTHAVNFLYGLEFYLEESNGVRPEYLLKIAEEMELKKNGEWIKLRIYFLTHVIIGESRFYSREIRRKKGIYNQMFDLLEEIIEERYVEISLDNKFEFLVCGRLLNRRSSLEERIFAEADDSLSKVGNFLVDTHNERVKKAGDNLLISEHRNVLYLMAKSDREK